MYIFFSTRSWPGWPSLQSNLVNSKELFEHFTGCALWKKKRSLIFSRTGNHHRTPDSMCCEAVTEKYGAPDILVNNAGITKDGGGWMVVCQQWKPAPVEKNIINLLGKKRDLWWCLLYASFFCWKVFVGGDGTPQKNPFLSLFFLFLSNRAADFIAGHPDDAYLDARKSGSSRMGWTMKKRVWRILRLYSYIIWNILEYDILPDKLFEHKEPVLWECFFGILVAIPNYNQCFGALRFQRCWLDLYPLKLFHNPGGDSYRGAGVMFYFSDGWVVEFSESWQHVSVGVHGLCNDVLMDKSDEKQLGWCCWWKKSCTTW